jgi:hypothetical protein
MENVIDEILHFETEYVRIEYLLEKKYILVTWKKFADDDEQIAFREKLLEMIKNNKSASYLTDNRKLSGTTEKVQKWIRDRWFPAAYDAGLRNIATIETSDKYAKYAINTILEGEIFKRLNTRQFKTFDDAEKWLMTI